MALQLPFSVEVLNPLPLDAKYLAPTGIPYADVNEVNSTIPSGIRHLGLTVLIGDEEYWYKNGVTDLDLVAKASSGGTVTGSGTTNELTYWTGSSSIGSLSTATYPSLTELSYVKGLTSSAETQITARELLTNKATSFVTLNNTLYPTTQALFQQRSVTGTDSLVAADTGKTIVFNSATPFNFTVDSVASGAQVALINKGAGTVTLVAGTGVTLTGTTTLATDETGALIFYTATTVECFSGGGGPGSYTFTDGIYNSGGTVGLSGSSPFTQNITLNIAEFSFGIEGQDGTEAGRFAIDYTNFSLEYENTGSALTGIIGNSTGLQLYTSGAFQVTADNGVSLMPPTSGTGNLRFLELAANGSHYVGFKGADSIAASLLWTLPSTDGTANYGLTTNGSGTLNWSNVLIGTGTNTLTGHTTITGSYEWNLGTSGSPIYSSYNAASAYIQQVIKATSDNSTLLNPSGFQVTLSNPASVFKFLGPSAPSVGDVWTASNTDGTGYWAAPSGGGLTIGSTSITGGTSGRLLTSGTTVGEQTLGTGVSTFLSTPSWTNFQSAITGTSPYLPLTGATYTTTTGNGLDITSSTVTSGNLVSFTNTGTAAASNTKTVLNVASSGANGTSSQTTYAARFSNTGTGTSSTNVGLSSAASGGTNNIALQTTAGNTLLFSDAISKVYFGSALTYPSINTPSARRVVFDMLGASTVASPSFLLSTNSASTFTSSSSSFLQLSVNGFSPTSGTGEYSFLHASGVINQTGGANGSTRGVFVNPTLTSAAAFKAFSYSPVSGSATEEYAFHATQGDIYTAGNVIGVNLKAQRPGVKSETVVYNVGTLGSSSSSSQSIHINSYYANNTTIVAKITVVAIKTDGTASAHATVTARFRKDNSGTFTVDDAGTDITSDITILADVRGTIGSTNPQVTVDMGASSGNWEISWTAETVEVTL